jgi:hypothetical protein
MKKFIQVCSLLSLLVVFGAAASIKAQGFGTEVSIPFAFNVADHSYDAGSYVLKLFKNSSGTATLSITDTKTDAVQTVLLNVNGDLGGSEIKLVFDNVEGQRYLSKVQTTERTYALLKSKAVRDALKAAKTSDRADSAAAGDSAN